MLEPEIYKKTGRPTLLSKDFTKQVRPILVQKIATFSPTARLWLELGVGQVMFVELETLHRLFRTSFHFYTMIIGIRIRVFILLRCRLKM